MLIFQTSSLGIFFLQIRDDFLLDLSDWDQKYASTFFEVSRPGDDKYECMYIYILGLILNPQNYQLLFTKYIWTILMITIHTSSWWKFIAFVGSTFGIWLTSWQGNIISFIYATKLYALCTTTEGMTSLHYVKHNAMEWYTHRLRKKVPTLFNFEKCIPEILWCKYLSNCQTNL